MKSNIFITGARHDEPLWFLFQMKYAAIFFPSLQPLHLVTAAEFGPHTFIETKNGLYRNN